MSRIRINFKVILTLLLAFLVYLLLCGLFIFLVHRPSSPKTNSERFFSDMVGPDRALIIEERSSAATIRIDLIEGAKSSLRIAYYAVHDGLSSDIFYASLIEAAERGVEVELLFDGIFHNLKGREKETYWALVNHPNIRVKFYEIPNLFKPWTINNRLHDKFILVDDTYVLLGGRNIGDKYFLESYPGSFVEDRDVLVVNTAENLEESVLGQFKLYFEYLWSHQYTVEKDSTPPQRYVEVAVSRQKGLLEKLNNLKREYPSKFNHHFDWESLTLPTNKVTLITNPVERLNKSATILSEIAALAETSQESLLFQSPYIIPDRHIRGYLGEEWEANLYLLTNSTYSSPNYFAMAGYLKHRSKLAKKATTLYEYYGEGTIHAKSYIFDQRISMIGSFNLDPRSAFLSTESMVVIDSIPIAKALSDNIVELIGESVPYSTEADTPQKTPFFKSFLIGTVRLLLYPFDPLL